MNCKNCKSTDIKTRKNYSHGKSSGGKKVLVCKECGSTNIEVPQKNTFRRRR